ncbi:MAG: 6-carboxytetrahydropterin synthase QueD [Proteobacteria bacterium]|nr:MAG: 6-carboxytetrahydropterin synthase QueD [Pseudomonadota bacterium]
MSTSSALSETFEAAHRLPHVPASHKCYRIHGHSYRCELVLASDAHRDQAEVALRAVVAKLRHRYLNELPGLENATSEHIALWIWRALERRGVAPEAVSVAENDGARCTYRGQTS